MSLRPDDSKGSTSKSPLGELGSFLSFETVDEPNLETAFSERADGFAVGLGYTGVVFSIIGENISLSTFLHSSFSV